MGKYVHIEVSAIKDFSLIVNFRLPNSLCIACMDVAILVNIKLYMGMFDIKVE